MFGGLQKLVNLPNFRIGAIMLFAFFNTKFSILDHDARCIYFITVPNSSPDYRGYDILEDGCLQARWEPISEYDRNGQILGYTITYVADCFQVQDIGHEGNVTVSGSSNNVTLCNLRPGWKYRLGFSGSTSKGMGPTSHHDVYAGKKCVIITSSFLFSV